MSTTRPSGSSRNRPARLAPDKRLDLILTAARAVLAANGYEKTVLADIAAQAGIVEGTIYRYFHNKRDLLERVAEIWFTEKLALDSQVASLTGTRAKLRHLAVRTLAIIRSDPVLSRFMLMELRADPGYRRTPFFQLNKRFTQEVVDVCQQAIDRGEFLPDISAALLRNMFFGCIEHSTWAFLRGEGDFSSERVADGIADIICRGMSGNPQAESNLDAIAARLERVETLLVNAPWSQRAG